MIVSIHILFGFPPFFYRRAKMRRWPAGAPVGKSRHIREAKDVLFLGPPGVGKTHLAQGIGYEAIRQNFLMLYPITFKPPSLPIC
jgi:SpoVK/Ycf46/Vps4 family AAA+-type ATPase